MGTTAGRRVGALQHVVGAMPVAATVLLGLGLGLVTLGGCGGGQSQIDYPSRFALLTKLEGRLGTLRQMLPGRARSFAPDLELTELVGLPTSHLRSHLGPPMDCAELSRSRRRLICREGELVYRFFVGEDVRDETYLVVDPNGTNRITRATWRVVRKRIRSPRSEWWEGRRASR